MCVDVAFYEECGVVGVDAGFVVVVGDDVVVVGVVDASAGLEYGWCGVGGEGGGGDEFVGFSPDVGDELCDKCVGSGVGEVGVCGDFVGE